MIDLRSDTLSMPDRAMLETILSAQLGDDGRLDAQGRGEDKAINELEDVCAELTGKEAGLLCVSGTMGNQVALMTWCEAGDTVLVEAVQHLYKSEKTAFASKYTRLSPVFYHLDAEQMPDLSEIRAALEKGGVKLLCIENTHNFSGGACITPERMKAVYELAHEYGVSVHLDGARLFNAAVHLGVPVSELCRYTDSVMFCFSKGLAAPVGSILCGTSDFIKKAKDTRKLLGGALRQGGIIAAPALYALTHNVERLSEDHENCRICAEGLTSLRKLKVLPYGGTNILVIDVSESGLSQEAVCDALKERGLWIKPVLDRDVRLVFYKGITKKDAEDAARILREFDETL